MEAALFVPVAFIIGFLLGKERREREENQGEAAVRCSLVRLCRGSTSHVLNNVTLRHGDGTTQIDHVLITERGVLVIETKHYRGWIFANANSSTWTQVIYKVKNRFQNPLYQNSKHVRAVRKLLDFLPKEYINGAVVFTGDAQFKTAIPGNVIRLHQLESHARGFHFGTLSENRIQFCVGRLECHRFEITGRTDVAHQRYLERRFGVVD